MMSRTRGAGFGPEVKRRIMLGTYALSAGYYEAYYGQAQKVRTLIIRDYEQAFASYDVLVSPTSPTTAFRIGERTDDPLAMYLSDVFTIPANLAGVPAISIPSGLDEAGLPVGVQLTAPILGEALLLRVADALERAIGFDARPPILAGIDGE
jgi:aspartyl-tRNA(Asn)/glutamyl-tRNA(Gln) amidotransferase subunit A